MRRSHPAPIPGSLAEAGRHRFVLKRPAIGAMMAGLSLVALAHSAFAACGDNPDDANAVAAARQAADSPCDCSTAKTHRSYVRCVAGAARAAVNSGTLSEECKARLLACAAGSTCGRPSAVRCCRTDANGVTHCQTVRRAAACRAPRGGSVCVSTTSNGSCAADPCGSLASTPAGVPVSTTTTSTTTTTTDYQKQCCGSVGGAFVGECVAETACDANHPLSVGPGSCSPNPCPLTTTTAPATTTTSTTQAQVQCCGLEGGAFVGQCVVETTCDANHPYNFGPGSCSPNPCPLTTTTTAPGATTTTTTGAAPTTTIQAPPTTTTTTTTRPPTTTTTLRMCSGGVFPQCGGSCPVGKHCRPFGRTKSCVCR